MHHGSRPRRGRIPCLLVALGLLITTAPGCGDGAITKDESAGGIPTVLKKSNDQMENFIKSKTAAKKK